MARKFSILVADKNGRVRDVLMRELAAEGYEVTSSKDLNHILLKLEGDNPPDLLVLDLEIPDVDSAGIIEKTQKRNPPLPVIIHTFLTEESERDGQNGNETYLEKSGNIDHLKSAIADTLEKYYPETIP